MDGGEDRTADLLARWNAGDRAALEELLERDLPWIRAQVGRRLGAALRRKAETADFVQDAVLEALRYSPRFLVERKEQFRGLLVRIIENTVRDQHDFFRARRRAMDRECPIPSDSVLRLAPGAKTVTRPSEAVARKEEQARLRLALELVAPDDRRVILLRQWDDKDFDEIAVELGTTRDAARMRFRRAVTRLARKVEQLEDGDVERAVAGPAGT